MTQALTTIERVYEDKVESLLDQYHNQLNYHEDAFHERNKHLDAREYAALRDEDQILAEILRVIEQIYTVNIPIALIIITEENDGRPRLTPDASAGPKH